MTNEDHRDQSRGGHDDERGDYIHADEVSLRGARVSLLVNPRYVGSG